MIYENDFQERMAIGKDIAQRDRNRGGSSSVRVYATTRAMLAPLGADANAQTFEAESRARWNFAVSQFVEDVIFDCYGDQWEGFA